MYSLGNVLKLFISKRDFEKRVKKESIKIDNNGVLEDKFYNKDIDRSLLIVSTDTYKMIYDNDIRLEYGDLGENILTDFNPYSLKIGTKIKVGETILEISKVPPVCRHLVKFDKRLPKLIINDRGIFAKVIKGGEVRLNDKFHYHSSS